MAELTSVRDALMVRFAAQRVVFWHDPTGEYETELDALNLGDVNIIRVKNDDFGVKNRLLADHVTKHLVHWCRTNSFHRPATKTVSTRPIQPSSAYRRATPNSTCVTASAIVIKAAGGSAIIENEPKVGAYLAALRADLVETINNGKRISI